MQRICWLCALVAVVGCRRGWERLPVVPSLCADAVQPMPMSHALAPQPTEDSFPGFGIDPSAVEVQRVCTRLGFAQQSAECTSLAKKRAAFVEGVLRQLQEVPLDRGTAEVYRMIVGSRQRALLSMRAAVLNSRPLLVVKTTEPGSEKAGRLTWTRTRVLSTPEWNRLRVQFTKVFADPDAQNGLPLSGHAGSKIVEMKTGADYRVLVSGMPGSTILRLEQTLRDMSECRQ